VKYESYKGKYIEEGWDEPVWSWGFGYMTEFIDDGDLFYDFVCIEHGLSIDEEEADAEIARCFKEYAT